MAKTRLTAKKHAMVCILICVVCPMWTALAAGAEANKHDSSALLFVCQDEETLERQIAKYIQDTHHISATVKFGKEEDDLYLQYKVGSKDDGIPPMTVIVDSMVSARNKETDRASEQCIKLRGYFVLPKSVKTPENRRKILELNNSFMNEVWVPGGVYLDKDVDVIFATTLNIPSPETPIHAEMIHDQLARFVMSWTVYYERLSATIDLPQK